MTRDRRLAGSWSSAALGPARGLGSGEELVHDLGIHAAPQREVGSRRASQEMPDQLRRPKAPVSTDLAYLPDANRPLASPPVAFLGDGAIVATHQHVLIGAELAALGVAFIGTALASLSDRRASIGAVAVCGLGMEFAALGMALLAERHAFVCLVLIGVGLAIVVDGMTLAIDSLLLKYTAVITSGLALIGIGAALLAGRQPLTGGAVILLGVAIIGTAPGLAGRHRLGYTAITASGVADIITGIAWHSEHQVLIVAMVIAGGVATTWFGSMEIRGLRRLGGSIVKGPSA